MEGILLLAVILLGLTLLAFNIPWNRFKKKERVSSNPTTTDHSIEEDVEDTTEEDLLPERREEIDDDEDDSPDTVVLGNFKRRFRMLRTEGNDDKTILEKCFAESGETLDEDGALCFCIGLDCKPEIVSTFFASRGWSPSEIVRSLDKYYDFSLEEWRKLLLPILKGETPLLKANELLELLKEVDDRPEVEDNLKEYAVLFLGIGCDTKETVKLLYEKSEASFGSVITNLPDTISLDPPTLAGFVEKLELDLTDSDIYEDLREEAELDFDTVAQIFRLRGIDLQEVVECELAYEELDESAVYRSLVAAGYKISEVLSKIYRANDEISLGSILSLALQEEDTPLDEVVLFLKEEGCSAEDIDEALREEEIDLRQSVHLLHTFFASEDKEEVGADEEDGDSPQSED